MIAVDLDEGTLYDDREIKDMLAGPHALRRVDRATSSSSIADQQAAPAEPRCLDRDELRRRQVAAG